MEYSRSIQNSIRKKLGAKMTFKIDGIVRDKNGIVLAIGVNGLFSTDNDGVIKQLQDLGFKDINAKPKIIKKEKIK